MGRPPFYATVEELQSAIDAYFDSCGVTYLRDPEGKIECDKHGNPIVLERNPPTVTGLALALGFLSRQSLINYQGKKAFHDTVTRAKLRVENFHEKKLFDPELRPQGPIFALYNFGWSSPSATRDQSVGPDPEAIAKENRSRYQKLFGAYGKPKVAGE